MRVTFPVFRHPVIVPKHFPCVEFIKGRTFFAHFLAKRNFSFSGIVQLDCLNGEWNINRIVLIEQLL